MDLHEALTQISEIRQQVARTETFRGYRAAPVAFSGVLALSAAVFQPILITDVSANLAAYLGLWVGAALLSMVVTGIAVVWHCKQSESPLTTTNTRLAIGQFLPCVVAGGLVTLAIAQHAEQSAWMLPGLWCILFGLGIFASYRLLPSATFWVGVYYLIAGTANLAWSRDLSPWAMGVPFGLGQFLSAGILYWTLERKLDDE